jgi:predicted DNA-binding protein (UPF0278 family)
MLKVQKDAYYTKKSYIIEDIAKYINRDLHKYVLDDIRQYVRRNIPDRVMIAIARDRVWMYIREHMHQGMIVGEYMVRCDGITLERLEGAWSSL